LLTNPAAVGPNKWGERHNHRAARRVPLGRPSWPALAKEAADTRVKMPKVILYTTRFCPYCLMAKRLLAQKGADFEEIDVGADSAVRQEMTIKANGRRTVPQIWIGETHVGGCNELYELEARGELDRLLAG
jgi:glutaredoxin 3